MAMAIDRPIADQREYRPPTQSQNSNILCVSMPKLLTSLVLVDRATKCLATWASCLACARNQSLAVWALVSVSWVVKVLEATMNSVVSGFRRLVVSAIWVPSIFDTKWTLSPSWAYGFRASVTMTGTRSDNTMTIFNKAE